MILVDPGTTPAFGKPRRKFVGPIYPSRGTADQNFAGREGAGHPGRTGDLATGWCLSTKPGPLWRIQADHLLLGTGGPVVMLRGRGGASPTMHPAGGPGRHPRRSTRRLISERKDLRPGELARPGTVGRGPGSLWPPTFGRSVDLDGAPRRHRQGCDRFAQRTGRTIHSRPGRWGRKRSSAGRGNFRPGRTGKAGAAPFAALG